MPSSTSRGCASSSTLRAWTSTTRSRWSSIAARCSGSSASPPPARPRSAPACSTTSAAAPRSPAGTSRSTGTTSSPWTPPPLRGIRGGADQLRAAGLIRRAQPGAAHRHAAHGDPRGARLRLVAGGPRGPPGPDDGRGAAAVRQGVPAAVSAPVVRRPAAARGHRHGVRQPAQGHRPRRADHRPGRDHAGARAGHGPRPHQVLRGRGALHHPRPRRGRQPRRPHRRHVRRAGWSRSAPATSCSTQGHHPYTRKLLASIPDITGERALRGIPGWAPRPGQRPSGCTFTPRCDWAVDKCSEEFPPVEDVSPGHHVRCWRYKEVGAQAAGLDIQLRDKSLSAPQAQENAGHQRA